MSNLDNDEAYGTKSKTASNVPSGCVWQIEPPSPQCTNPKHEADSLSVLQPVEIEQPLNA
jgi:hypothetical protein